MTIPSEMDTDDLLTPTIFDNEFLLQFISEIDEPVGDTLSFQASSTPSLGRSHSLEIPDKPWRGGQVTTSNTATQTTDIDDVQSSSCNFDSDWCGESAIAGDMHKHTVTPSAADTISAISKNSLQLLIALSRQCKSRVSRKEQIADLRRTVSILSQKLASLQSSHLSSSQSLSLWEHIAGRQSSLRYSAETENAKLKSLIVVQKRLNSNIKRLLRRRLDAELLSEICNTKRQFTSDSDTERIFDMLLGSVDHVYANLDKRFTEAAISCPGRKRSVYPDAAIGDTFLEFMDGHLVSFDFRRTESAVWIFLPGRRVRLAQRVCSEGFQQTDDISKSCVGFTNAGIGTASYVHEQRVVRRFVEDKRTVFVCRTISIPTCETWSPSVKYSETLSIVVRAGSPLVSGRETTIIESCLTTAIYKGQESTPQRWKECVNTATKGWDLKLSSNSQQIENLLFN